MLVELDGAAERLVDPRSARRLVPLELSDVDLPPSTTATRSFAPVLFFRVLGRPDGSLRVELWERGEFHGSRALSTSHENPQLVARRVALVAAELGRRLARKRKALLERERSNRARRALLLEQWRSERTQEGPRALRAELGFAAVPSKAWFVSSRLGAELSLAGMLRLDLGAELGAGRLQPGLASSLYAVSVGPAYRLALLPRLEVDLGLDAAALLLRAPGAFSVDGLRQQDASWSARARSSLRLELRLAHDVRASLGAELGALLRRVSYQADDRAPRALNGLWLGGQLGLIVTPSP